MNSWAVGYNGGVMRVVCVLYVFPRVLGSPMERWSWIKAPACLAEAPCHDWIKQGSLRPLRSITSFSYWSPSSLSLLVAYQEKKDFEGSVPIVFSRLSNGESPKPNPSCADGRRWSKSDLSMGRELADLDSNQMRLKAPFLLTLDLLVSLLFMERKVAARSLLIFLD